MLVYILFVVGFFILIKGADWMVLGATSVAKKYNISDIVVGLTIVSFGTSLPELIVNLYASFNDTSDIALGNIIGSNIANILLILGVTAIICPLPIQKNTIFSEIPFSIMATFLFAFLVNSSLTGGVDDGMLSQQEGAVLLFFFLLFLAYIYHISQREGENPVESPSDEVVAMPKAFLFMTMGILGLFFGGQWVTDGAVHIAQQFGLSESFIGLTIVAIGTSLPELVTSAMAAIKKNIDIAVGNVVGSNIFNLLWILGLSGTIKALPFSTINNFDIWVVVAASTLLLGFLIAGRKRSISRLNGIVLLLCYIAYLTFITSRG